MLLLSIDFVVFRGSLSMERKHHEKKIIIQATAAGRQNRGKQRETSTCTWELGQPDPKNFVIHVVSVSYE